MSALYEAYAEYLERMFAESDELALVDALSVPDTANLPVVEEWAILD